MKEKYLGDLVITTENIYNAYLVDKEGFLNSNKLMILSSEYKDYQSSLAEVALSLQFGGNLEKVERVKENELEFSKIIESKSFKVAYFKLTQVINDMIEFEKGNIRQSDAWKSIHEYIEMTVYAYELPVFVNMEFYMGFLTLFHERAVESKDEGKVVS